MGDVLLHSDHAPVLSIDGFSGQSDELISLLQSFQKQDGYISEESVQQIAQFLKVSETHVLWCGFILYTISF